MKQIGKGKVLLIDLGCMLCGGDFIVELSLEFEDLKQGHVVLMHKR